MYHKLPNLLITSKKALDHIPNSYNKNICFGIVYVLPINCLRFYFNIPKFEFSFKMHYAI